jgi:hypothetical protein
VFLSQRSLLGILVSSNSEKRLTPYTPKSARGNNTQSASKDPMGSFDKDPVRPLQNIYKQAPNE